MKIAVIGAGAMGGATVEGLIKGQQFRNEDITVSDDRAVETGVPVLIHQLRDVPRVCTVRL